MKTENFTVKGMSCGHCKKAVESALSSVDGVEDVKVSLEEEKVEVKFNEEQTTLDKLKTEVRAAGYEVT